ncbi:rCG44122, partial [Rattus norvegicus]
MNMKCP